MNSFLLNINISFILIFYASLNLIRNTQQVVHIFVYCKKNEKIFVVATNCGSNYSFLNPIEGVILYNIHCDPELIAIDGEEIGSILRFLIQVRKQPLADKYIFIHGHEISPHYPTPISNVIQNLIKTKYFKSNNFGGVFPSKYAKTNIYHHNNPLNGRIQCRFGDISLKNIILEIFPKYFIKFENFSKWQYPCCETFFVSQSCINHLPLYIYQSILKNLHIYSSKHACDKINEKICISINNKNRPCSNHLAGIAVEYSWGMLFTNTSFIQLYD